MGAALVISSTRVHVSANAALRMQDIVSSLLRKGYEVDVLVPRLSPLIVAALPREVRLLTIPSTWGGALPPERATWRRLLMTVLMTLRAVSLLSRTPYDFVCGLDDGVFAARAADRFTLRRFAYLADIQDPLSVRNRPSGIASAIAARLERKALRHAAAVTLAAEDTLAQFDKPPTHARFSVLPSPHAEMGDDAFTIAEFDALFAKVIRYARVFREGAS